MTLDCYLMFLLGVAIGSLIVNLIWSHQKTSGTLKVDLSNPEKDIYRLEVDDLDSLSEKKLVVFKVDKTADLSQK